MIPTESNTFTVRLKSVSSVAFVVCAVLGVQGNVTSAQDNSPFKVSSGGGGRMRGTFSPPRRTAGAGGSGFTLSGARGSASGFTLYLEMVIALEEGVSPGMSYAVSRTSRKNQFAYFCVLLHDYSEEMDDIRYDVRVESELGDIKQSYRIGALKFPLAYSVAVDRQAKEREDVETLKIDGAEVDLRAYPRTEPKGCKHP